MVKVIFNPNRSVTYIRGNELNNNNCETGLCDASDEEFVNYFRNEEFDGILSDTDDDRNGNLMIACIIIWFIFFSLLVIVLNKNRLNEFNDKIYLMFSPFLLLPIIMIVFLICKVRKSRRTLLFL